MLPAPVLVRALIGLCVRVCVCVCVTLTLTQSYNPNYEAMWTTSPSVNTQFSNNLAAVTMQVHTHTHTHTAHRSGTRTVSHVELDAQQQTCNGEASLGPASSARSAFSHLGVSSVCVCVCVCVNTQAGEYDSNFDGKPDVIRVTARVAGPYQVYGVTALLQFNYSFSVSVISPLTHTQYVEGVWADALSQTPVMMSGFLTYQCAPCGVLCTVTRWQGLAVCRVCVCVCVCVCMFLGTRVVGTDRTLCDSCVFMCCVACVLQSNIKLQTYGLAYLTYSSSVPGGALYADGDVSTTHTHTHTHTHVRSSLLNPVLRALPCCPEEASYL